VARSSPLVARGPFGTALYCRVTGYKTPMTIASWAGLAAFVLYLVASIMVLRRLRSAVTTRNPALLMLSLAAVALHALCLGQTAVTDEGVRLGLFPMASLITGTGAALITVAGLYRRLEWVSAMVFPLSALSIP